MLTLKNEFTKLDLISDKNKSYNHLLLTDYYFNGKLEEYEDTADLYKIAPIKIINKF